VAKVETTTKKFKEGIPLSSATGTEVVWESTGHIAVRLTDELGQVPLKGREGKVTIPGEGEVSLTADDDGWMRHPDVPFADYDIDLGDGVRVHVPAVANPGDGHDRHVPGVRFGFVNLFVGDDDGSPLAEVELQLEGPDGTETVRTDKHGMVRAAGPRPPGEYTVRFGERTATTTLPDRAKGIAIVAIPEEDEA